MAKKALKYLIGYKFDRKVKVLFIMLPKMSAYRRDFDETKYMSFLRRDDELLGKHNKICDKRSNCVKNCFVSESVYNKKHLKMKIKSYEGKINTNFYGDKVPQEGSHLSINNID